MLTEAQMSKYLINIKKILIPCLSNLETGLKYIFGFITYTNLNSDSAKKKTLFIKKLDKIKYM